MAKKKILIVDDEPNIIKMVEVRLRANNYDVITASNGSEGLEKAKNEKPDLIILDMMMPKVDGFQFFKTIRKDPEQSNIPIMMLTARGAMKDTFETLGAEEFITKPFESEDLLLKINHVFKNNAIVLSGDTNVADHISKALREAGYEITVVADEEAMVKKGREVKYKTIVAHFRYVKKEPADFALNIRMMRQKNPQVILYFDAAVKTSEQKDIMEMATLKNKWRSAGVEHFFDAQMANQSLANVLKSLTA